MMKTIKLLALTLGLLVMGSHVLPAQDVEPTAEEQTETTPKKKKKAKKKKAKAKAGAVAKALKKVKRVSGRVNQNALVYIYLQSASWCGPCKQAMPGIVEQYKEMRKDGRVEIVLVGHDYTAEGVKEYIEGYKCKMPAVWKDAKNVKKLPGFSEAEGIPNAIIVDADGKVLRQGYPTMIISAWKELADSVEAEKAAAEDAAEATEDGEE